MRETDFRATDPQAQPAVSVLVDRWSHLGRLDPLGYTPLPGEELAPFRPKLYMVRDVGSGAYLSIQLGNSLNRYLVYMAIAEAIIRFGVIPEALQTDNGSEIATTRRF
jgi:hypothetical protein